MYHTFTAVFFLVLISVTMASNCTQCTAERKQRTGNSSFQIKDGCWEYSCFCNCDGSWNCPTEDAREVCWGTHLFSSCGHCQVRGYMYRGDSNFTYKDGCYRFFCTCNCDGSWNCPPSQKHYLCYNN